MNEKHSLLTYSELQNLLSQKPFIRVIDQINLSIAELFDIKHPEKKDTKEEAEVNAFASDLVKGDLNEWGSWVYYPWLQTVVHTPPQPELFALRTSRNRLLITSEEQKKLAEAAIMVVGMSVGSNVAEALVSQGIGGKLVLIDMDIIEPTNLNRIRSPFHHVGLHKVEAISRKIWEIDPYLKIVQVNDGLNDENIDTLFEEHNISVVVDEMDELRMKIKLREKAAQKQLPLLMATDDGDNALLDIERYDLDAETEAFNGSIPQEILTEVMQGDYPRPKLGMVIGKYFVGTDNIPLRMYRSLSEVGRTLPSWPQLGGAAALGGIAVAYLAKQIILGEKISSGTQIISLDEMFNGNKLSEQEQQELAGFKEFLNSAV